jgi:hypothetical protein
MPSAAPVYKFILDLVPRRPDTHEGAPNGYRATWYVGEHVTTLWVYDLDGELGCEANGRVVPAHTDAEQREVAHYLNGLVGRTISVSTVQGCAPMRKHADALDGGSVFITDSAGDVFKVECVEGGGLRIGSGFKNLNIQLNPGLTCVLRAG